ncbi:MAG: hypothetical protein FWD44_06060 [Oscillospiraceae bacterium]|nr:hypothetical protein [Oscillospiraceae bacterium]
MKNNNSEFNPVYCPVLKKDIDPCLCYETRFGISNILEPVGVSENDAMTVCRNNCNRIRGFIEKSAIETSSAVAEKNVPYRT